MRKRYDFICIVHDFASLMIKYGQLEHSLQTHFKGGEINVTLILLQTSFQSAEAEEQLIESLKSKPNNATGREMEVS